MSPKVAILYGRLQTSSLIYVDYMSVMTDFNLHGLDEVVQFCIGLLSL